MLGFLPLFPPPHQHRRHDHLVGEVVLDGKLEMLCVLERTVVICAIIFIQISYQR